MLFLLFRKVFITFTKKKYFCSETDIPLPETPAEIPPTGTKLNCFKLYFLINNNIDVSAPEEVVPAEQPIVEEQPKETDVPETVPEAIKGINKKQITFIFN